jgi:hypothetical protein
MCPSASHMRPTVCRMRPLRRRMCPFDRRMRPSARRMRPSARRMCPTVCCMRPLRRRMRPSDKRMCPFASVCAPQPAVCARSNPDHPMWQRCGSHRGQSKSRFILSKVNKTLTLIGQTRTLSDVMDRQTDKTDGRTHRQPCLHALTDSMVKICRISYPGKLLRLCQFNTLCTPTYPNGIKHAAHECTWQITEALTMFDKHVQSILFNNYSSDSGSQTTNVETMVEKFSRTQAHIQQPVFPALASDICIIYTKLPS